MWNYSEKVKDHFFNPRNAKVLTDANAIGDVGSISCGDALRLMLKVNPDTEVITDAAFQTFGCGSAIASSSALTEIIIGKTLSEAEKITNRDIAAYLDGLPPEKMHCSVMGREALGAAIANYRGEDWHDDHHDGQLICKCFAVDEGKIIRAVKENGLTSLEDVLHYTKAGGGCGACHEKIEQVLHKTLAAHSSHPARDAAEHTSPSGRRTLPEITENAVNEILNEIRPRLQADNGDVSLVGIAGNKIAVLLSGNCSGCMMSEMTLSWLRQQFQERLGTDVNVVNIEQKEFIMY